MRNVYEEWQRLDKLSPEKKAEEINNFPEQRYLKDIRLIKKLIQKCAISNEKDLTLEAIGRITSEYKE